MSVNRWYFDHDGRQGGPVSVSQLRQLAANGELLPTDHVRKEDMDRWVKARAVKGLFIPADMPQPLDSEALAEPAGTDTMFDFFGGGTTPAAGPAQEFHPAFDFFGGTTTTPPAKPSIPAAEIEPQAIAAPPTRKSTPARKSKPDLPAPAIPVPAAPSSTDDSGTFRVAVPMAAPVEEPSQFAEIHSEVPMAMPASDIGMASPPVSAELTGPEVEMQSDGSVRLTGCVVELSVAGGWLAAKSTAPNGGVNETHMRLNQLTAATSRVWPTVGRVLSFHAGAQTIAAYCDGNTNAAEAFLKRVLGAAEST